MRNPPKGTRGASLVELAIALVLLTVVIGLPTMLLDTSGRAYSSRSAAGEVDLATRRALDRVAALLEASGRDVLPAAGAGPGTPFSTVDFQRAIGSSPAGPIWGTLDRIAMQPEPGDPVDGVDNDGDGLVDEQRVVWIENLGLPGQRVHVLCTRVRRALAGEIAGNGLDDNGNGLTDEGGLTLTFEGERVDLQLTVVRRDAFGGAAERTLRRSVALRN